MSAINPTYTDGAVLSKVKLGSNTYILKDADVRAILATFHDAVYKDVADTVAKDGTGLPTAGAVEKFVTDAIGDLGSVLNLRTETDHTKVSNPAKGDFVVEVDGKEWLYDGSAWREVGDETAYVLKTTKIAGIDLQDDITVKELQDALTLKALAYAATASVTLTDYVTGLTGASYTPAGSISIDSTTASANATLTKGDLSISATVAGKNTASGTVAIAKDSTGTQISGSNAASAVTVEPDTASFVKGYKDGKAPTAASFDVSKFSAGSFNKGTAVAAATEGVVASIGTGDDAETLIFTAASTDNVMDFDAAYTAPSMANDIFTANSVGELDTASAMTGVKSATAAAQVFTGDSFKATFTGSETDVTGTATQTITDGVITNVAYDKTTIGEDSSFTGTAATITPELVKGNKTVTVSPDAE